MAISRLKTLSFGLALALLVVITLSVAAAVAVNREARIREHEVARSVSLLVDAQRLNTMAERRTHHARLYLATRSPSALAIREEAQRQSEEAMDRMERLLRTDETRAELERIRALHATVYDAMEALLRLGREGVSNRELLARMEAEVMPLRETLDQELDGLMAEREQKLRRDIDAMEKGRQLPFTVLVGLVPVTLVVAGILAWRLVRTLRQMDRDRSRAEAEIRREEANARAAAEDAHRQKALLDAVLDAAPVGIVVADARGRILRMNPANMRMWGAEGPSGAASIRGNWRGWWADGTERHGRRIAPTEWALERALLGETTRDDLLEIEPFDAPGTRKTMLNSAAPVRSPGGEIIGGVVVQMDLTRLARMEAALRESEERFRTLADNISQLAWMADERGTLFWFNRRWYEYTGTSPEAPNDRVWRDVHDPKWLPRAEEGFRTAIASGEPWEDTFPLRRHDGEFRWHLSRAMPLRDETGRVVRWFGTNTDVEEQRRQASALQNAVEVRDVFLGVAAHELKTPLTSLGLRLAHLERQVATKMAGDDRDELVRSIEVSQTQVQRLGALVDMLLDVTRLQSDDVTLKLEDFEFAPVVREAVERVRANADRIGSPIRMRLEDGVCARADRMRVRQVLSNLLSNAMKFGAGTPIHVTLEASEGRARLSVRDEGIGIEPDMIGRLFDRFERGVSDRNYGGLGLGLFVSRQWVQAMNGTIEVESRPGEGATFIVELPLREAARPEHEPTPNGLPH